jgi:hypothetical protein
LAELDGSQVTHAVLEGTIPEVRVHERSVVRALGLAAGVMQQMAQCDPCRGVGIGHPEPGQIELDGVVQVQEAGLDPAPTAAEQPGSSGCTRPSMTAWLRLAASWLLLGESSAAGSESPPPLPSPPQPVSTTAHTITAASLRMTEAQTRHPIAGSRMCFYPGHRNDFRPGGRLGFGLLTRRR